MKTLSIFLWLCLTSLAVFAQEPEKREADREQDKAPQTYFEDGQYFLASSNYQEALYNFKQILQKGHANANINYLIGLCYNEIDGQKLKALPYLKKAQSNISREYQKGRFKEKRAPPETYFLLGQTYQIKYQFDSAISYFRKYLPLLPEEDQKGRRYTKKQIEACKNAAEFQANKKDYTITKLEQPVNTTNNNFRPVIGGKDSILAFMRSLKFYDGIFISRKKNDTLWGSPRNITQNVKSDGDLYTSSLSYDGKTLFLVRHEKFKSNIYISRYQNGEWQKHQEAANQINSKFWEEHASMTRDGKTIYFSSNRNRNNKGGMDIYKIQKNEDGNWSNPVNIGDRINTTFNEDHPFITNDGQKLFFCSQGHKTMGNYDIYYAVKKGEKWSKPKNLGYPINTPNDDMFFAPDQEGNTGYFARPDKKTGNKQIYKVHLDQ